MKIALLLFAAISWAAAARTGDPIKAFSPNREYRYDYESQILTGIPALNSQYSGLRIKSRVIIHVESDKYVTVKMASIEVFRVKEGSGVIPTAWVPAALLEPIPVEHSTELIEKLVIPIRFRYENGLVRKVYAAGVDPYWSVNIKRGIIGLMNLDLNVETPAPVDSSVLKPYMGIISSDYNTMSAKTAYKVIEPSILGDCETWYSMVPIPSVSKLMVTKVIDTKRCSPKIMAEWGIFAGMVSARNVNEENQVIGSSVSVDYELSGTRHEFMINSAVLTGKYSFAPVMDQIVSMDGYVIQKLAYIKDDPIGRPIIFNSPPVPLKRGLHAYIPAQELVTMDSINSMKMGEGRLETAKIEMVDKLLEVIVEKTVSRVEKEVPDVIQTVVSILRTLSKEQILQIVKTYSQAAVSGPESLIAKKRALILDILPTLPHPEVPLVLIRLIREGHITGVNAGVLINIATLVITPSPVIINELVEMVKEPEIIRQPAIHRAIILSVGIMSNKLVNLHLKMGIPVRTTSVLIKNVVREIKTLVETADVETKLAVIKAIGNAGIVDFFPDIERIVKDKSEPIPIREQAIYALRRITAITPKSIRRILLPVYLDPREPEDVRVAAFVIVMETRPGFGTLNAIGHSINTEPSIQVASFVYSYLQNVVRSPIPALRPISIIARRVLMTVRPVVVSPIFNSKSIDVNSACGFAKICLGMEFDKINRVNRALPVVIVNKIYTSIFGRRINVAEFGIELSGVDGIVRRLAGVTGILGDIMMGRRDISTILDPLSKIDLGEIEAEVRKLLAETDLPVPKPDIVRLAAYIKVFGNELNFFSLEKQGILDILAAISSSSYTGILDQLISGYNVDIVKAIPMMDNALILPTPIGLPITLNISAIAAITVKGQVKVEGITSIRDIFSSPRKLSAAVNIRPSAYIKVYQTIGIQHDIIAIGTTVRRSIAADLPMSFKVDIDRTMEKISVKIDVPKMVAPSVLISSTPALFYQYVPIRIGSYSPSMYEIHLPRIIPIACDKIFKAIPIMIDYEVPILALKAKISGVVNYPLPSFYDPVMLTMSPQEIGITLEPAYSTPEAIVVEVLYGERMVVRRETSDSWFGWLGGDEVEETPVVGDEFAPVTVSSVIASAVKKQLFINVLTVGGRHDAVIKSKLTLIHDPSWMIHQVNWQIVGSQVISSAWKVKFETLIHMPRLIRAIIRSPELLSSDAISSTDISFGVTSFTENTIIVKVLPTIMGVNPGVGAAATPFKSISLKAVIYYSRVTSGVRDNLISIVRMIKPWIVPYISHEKPTTIISGSDTMEVIFEIFPQVRKVNVIVATPVTTLYIYDVILPNVWPLVQPIVPPTMRLGVLPVLPEITTMTTAPSDIASALYGACVVTPVNITTVASNTMPLPAIEPSCEVVLAHDCSPQNLYTVISTPVTAAGARTITVIVPQIKAMVTKSLINGEVIVVINGERRPIPGQEPIVITRSIDGRVRIVLEIATVGKTHVIRAPQVGVVVEIMATDVVVKVSPLLISTACGICTYVPNIPIINPMATRIGVSAISPIMPPVHRFVVKSEQCPANGLMQFVPASSCHMTERTIKITRISEGIPQICFSVKPVAACSGFCNPARSTSEMIGFHCMADSDVMAITLARDINKRVLTEMANKVIHTYQPVMKPTVCVP